MTDVNVAIVSPDFDLLKATSAMCFPRIQVAFRWSPMAPPIVRLMGEPGVVLAADAFCYKKGRVGRVGHFGGKVSSCGEVRGWFSKVKGLYFHFNTSPVHHIWDDFNEFKQEPLVCT